ncbi:hypothetical protein HanIR_Chr05g0213951 [Helianthus annuus]|nr:hypothetical protein HanIR_Chr05g0213951 [Helianthus annuus]
MARLNANCKRKESYCTCYDIPFREVGKLALNPADDGSTLTGFWLVDGTSTHARLTPGLAVLEAPAHLSFAAVIF